MRKRIVSLIPPMIVIAASLDAHAFGFPVAALQAMKAVRDQGRPETVEITLFREMGWIREVRQYQLPGGVVEVIFPDIPAVQSGTAEVRVADGRGALRVLGLDCASEYGRSSRLGSAVALVETSPGERLLELSYVSHQMQWTASYTATLPADGPNAELVGYALVANRSGRTFAGARLQLRTGIANNYSGVEGDRAEIPVPFAPLERLGGLPISSSIEPMFEVESIDLESSTVNDGNDKSVEFVRLPSVALEVEHTVTFDVGARRENTTASMVAVLHNDAAHGMGKPLPGGMFSLFIEAPDGTRSLLGMGGANDTRAGDMVSIQLAAAPEVTASRMLVASDEDRRAKNCERSYRVVVRNEKMRAVTVIVRDPASARLLKSSIVSRAGSGATFAIPVAANSSADLTYTALYRCE